MMSESTQPPVANATTPNSSCARRCVVSSHETPTPHAACSPGMLQRNLSSLTSVAMCPVSRPQCKRLHHTARIWSLLPVAALQLLLLLVCAASAVVPRLRAGRGRPTLAVGLRLVAVARPSCVECVCGSGAVGEADDGCWGNATVLRPTRPV